ncbi:MAG TPA: hypothetical protein VER98_01550 [Terriglobia bacterium]|nr:hypothetical protein [Terriglobia bacterium]
MKKVVLIVLTCLAVMAAGGVIALRVIAAKGTSRSKNVSQKSAQALQTKIDAIKKTADAPGHKRGSSQAELSEDELESYVLYSLKEDIPGQIDSIDVKLAPDIVSAATQITFTSNATGNALADALVGGTHNLFLKGKLVGHEGRGKFDLQEIQVDGIPVPNVLIQALIKRYVKPKYPEVDLNEPFDLPWEIQEIKLEQGKATVVY